MEAVLALHFAELPPHFDLSVYFDPPYQVCFHRRKGRDITERQRCLDGILWQPRNTLLRAARPYLLPGKV